MSSIYDRAWKSLLHLSLPQLVPLPSFCYLLPLRPFRLQYQRAPIYSKERWAEWGPLWCTVYDGEAAPDMDPANVLLCYLRSPAALNATVQQPVVHSQHNNVR